MHFLVRNIANVCIEMKLKLNVFVLVRLSLSSHYGSISSSSIIYCFVVCNITFWIFSLSYMQVAVQICNVEWNIIRAKSRFYLKNESLRILCFTMIYPYLQYYNLVLASTYPSNLSRLVILQKRVIRIINKSDFNAHTNPIHKALHL